MMKGKNIAIFAGIFLALGILWFLTGDDTTPAPKEKFASIDIDNLSKIEIIHDKSSILLEKKHDIWVLPQKRDYPVDEDALKRAIQPLSQISVSYTASEKMDKLSQFGLDQEQATQLNMTIGGRQRALYIGSMGPEYSSTFIKDGDKNKVLNVSNRLFSLFPTNSTNWVKKRIFDFESNDLTALSSKWDTGEISFIYQDDKWHLTKPVEGPANESLISRLKSSFANMRIYDVPDEIPENCGFEKPWLSISATLKDGSQREIHFGNLHNPNYRYATVASINGPILISNYAIGDFVEGQEEKLLEMAIPDQDGTLFLDDKSAEEMGIPIIMTGEQEQE